MNTVNSILRTLNHELGEIASSMDTNAWIIMALVTVVAGFLFLRGNVIRST